MKKRILAALLAASMALCAGCGSQTGYIITAVIGIVIGFVFHQIGM